MASSPTSKKQKIIQNIRYIAVDEGISKLHYFKLSKISEDLKIHQQFVQSLLLVEHVIDNDNLCSYYSYMCDKQLHSENFFNFAKAKEVILTTRSFIIDICNHLNFAVADLPNDYSHFDGYKHSTNSSADVIEFDRSLILGCDPNSCRPVEILFLWLKILHELAHAIIFQFGRIHLRSEKNLDIKYQMPKTYCLQSEAGDALERMLVGSSVDAPGVTTSGKYFIQYLILSDGRQPGVIHNSWIEEFVLNAVNMDMLKTIESIKLPSFDYLTKTTKKKLEKGKRSRRKLVFSSSSSDSDDEDVHSNRINKKVKKALTTIRISKAYNCFSISDCVKQNETTPHYTTFNYENILGILNRLTHVHSKYYPKQLYDFVLNLVKHHREAPQTFDKVTTTQGRTYLVPKKSLKINNDKITNIIQNYINSTRFSVKQCAYSSSTQFRSKEYCKKLKTDDSCILYESVTRETNIGFMEAIFVIDAQIFFLLSNVKIVKSDIKNVYVRSNLNRHTIISPLTMIEERP
ncbi:unnamed protein product [Didymodactylos carnosus]|uniref:Uncharacterized protein n=1 Tax=Didymodactylos carnosus TaxID=1234261 RepID=A0A814V063_9BILA|nr:unnamed protein product [Didymodactylos carnosus]CAF1201438.1 unnamed protein product [Didymodactylos carnosus]CAF3945530.1 unnamed protein product [Didymodactylos carnosus]CAF4011247.1 unnamed protein product [Didymodactylos carnosus]